MADDKQQGIVTQFLHSLGALTWPTVDAFWQNGRLKTPARDKADLMGGINGRVFLVETKNDSSAFYFASWTEGQRQWAETYACRQAKIEYWVALILGTGRVNATDPAVQRKRFWLVPRTAFLLVEAQLAPQKSLPYDASNALRLSVRHGNLDAVHLLAPYEILWYPKTDNPSLYIPTGVNIKSAWRLPRQHPFFKMYIAPGPLPLYEETCHDEAGRGFPLAPSHDQLSCPSLPQPEPEPATERESAPRPAAG